MQTFGERRKFERKAVLKSAKIEWGDSVVDCLVVEQSVIGLRVSLPISMDIPKDITIHLRGGILRSATQRWISGSEIGLEFSGIAKLDAAAAENALAILVDLRGNGLKNIFSRLEDARFYDDAELSSTALQAQIAMQRFELMLQRQAEGQRASSTRPISTMNGGQSSSAITIDLDL